MHRTARAGAGVAVLDVPRRCRAATISAALVLCMLPLAAHGGGQGRGPQRRAAAELRLAVLLVNDPDFPPVTRSDADAILAAAQRTVADKLSFGELWRIAPASVSASRHC